MKLFVICLAILILTLIPVSAWESGDIELIKVEHKPTEPNRFLDVDFVLKNTRNIELKDISIKISIPDLQEEMEISFELDEKEEKKWGFGFKMPSTVKEGDYKAKIKIYDKNNKDAEITEEFYVKIIRPFQDIEKVFRTYLDVGESIYTRGNGFDNRYNITILQRDDKKVEFEINGERTGLIEEYEEVMISGLDLIVYSTKNIDDDKDEEEYGKVFFGISERLEMENIHRIKNIEEELNETKKEIKNNSQNIIILKKKVEKQENLIQQIINFLRDMFGFE